MKTDDRSNGRREPDPAEAKVVRLRDWLGPEEELVPIGPRADRLSRDAPVAEPDAGAGFWEGDASLHTAVPAPEPAPDDELRRGWRARARVALPWRWVAGGMAVATLAAAALLMVFGSGGTTPKHLQTEEAAIGQPLGPGLTKTIDKAAAATHAAARQGARAVEAELKRKRAAAARRKRQKAARARRRRAAAALRAKTSATEPVQSSSAPTYTETEATSPPPTQTEPVQTTPVETTPVEPTPTPSPPSGGGGGSSGGGGSGSSSSKTPAVGYGGALGPGSSPDG